MDNLFAYLEKSSIFLIFASLRTICSKGDCAFRSTSAWLYRRELCSMRRAGCPSFPILGGSRREPRIIKSWCSQRWVLDFLLKYCKYICIFQKIFVPFIPQGNSGTRIFIKILQINLHIPKILRTFAGGYSNIRFKAENDNDERQ